MDTITNTEITDLKSGSCRPDPNRVTLCKTCRHTGSTCKTGYTLINSLHAAISAADNAVLDDFEISGTLCTSNCGRNCTLAYRASRKAAYLFGDVAPDQNIDSLVEYAEQYRRLEDSGCLSDDHSKEPHITGLTRVPAAMIATTTDAVPVV
jgi:predicted metal-binding protein